jgi:nucleotide-binding universal stress UspA family protein
MHKHILIPTDGSDLSYEAIQYGIALAKAANARVTGLTVSTPFHVFAVEPEMVARTELPIHNFRTSGRDWSKAKHMLVPTLIAFETQSCD